MSKSTGDVYYRNTVFNSSSWDIPTEPAQAGSTGVAPAPAPTLASVAVAVEAAAPVEERSSSSSSSSRPHPQQQQSQSAYEQEDVARGAPAPPSVPQQQKKLFVHPDRLKLAGDAAQSPLPSPSSGAYFLTT